MKKGMILLLCLSSVSFANEMSNPCVYHPNLPGCAGNNRPIGQTNRVINIPDRWGAIYLNSANLAIGYSENNTKGEEFARREALANCIKAGGGKNPIGRNGKGCDLMTQNRNSCSAIAIGGVVGDGGAAGHSDSSLKKAEEEEEEEEEAIAKCSNFTTHKCSIRYSGCSRHPDYLRY